MIREAIGRWGRFCVVDPVGALCAALAAVLLVVAVLVVVL